MAPDERAYYDLESFWKDAKQVPLHDLVPAAGSA
jgi:ribosomal silencing factor RsfS